jgi:plastocyanin
VLFVICAAIAGVIGYLGISGALGGGIAGTQHHPPAGPTPLTSCEGKGALGHFTFVIISGIKGTYTFNGSSPGPCIAVASGSTVTVRFEVSSASVVRDSWELIGSSGPANSLPVFPGAGFSNDTRLVGLAPGQSVNLTFQANVAGEYRYVSEVGDHAAVGMWGGFNVTSAPLVAAHAAGPGPSPSLGGAGPGTAALPPSGAGSRT